MSEEEREKERESEGERTEERAEKREREWEGMTLKEEREKGRDWGVGG